MNIEQKRRELFDGWWATSGMEKFKETAWTAFNAALDAVVIELPGKFAADPDVGEEYDEFAMGMNTMLRNCNSAIESTGLGLKVLP